MATQEITGALVLGQRVYTSLYSRGPGIIVAIHGQQDSGSVRSLGGGVVMGGNATFDIAFKCGSFTKHLPECILRGVQWQISEEVADADEIIDTVQFCNAHAAREKEIAEAHKVRREEERKQYAAEYKHLLKKSDKPDYSPGRLAAENIRRELKAAYPSVTFKVTSDYDSVNIHWTNGPTCDAVKKITDKYRAGDFDGMTDSYSYDADATFADVFGDPKYVFPSRDWTTEGIRTAWTLAGRDAADIADDWRMNHTDVDRHIVDVWRDTDLIGKVCEAPKKPKAEGPFWSKRGLLAVDESGWTREFRKESTAQKELDKLTAKGIKAELLHGMSRGAIFIRKVD